MKHVMKEGMKWANVRANISSAVAHFVIKC